MSRQVSSDGSTLEACRVSFVGNPLESRWSSRPSLSSCLRGNQGTGPSSTPWAVVVSSIQFSFDPNALQELDNRPRLFATVGLSPFPGSATAPVASQRTAEMRPVYLGPTSAVASWYQCWGFAVADDGDGAGTASASALTVTLCRRAPGKSRLRRPSAEYLCRAVIPLKSLPFGVPHTERVSMPYGGTLAVCLQRCPPLLPPPSDAPAVACNSASASAVSSRLRSWAATLHRVLRCGAPARGRGRRPFATVVPTAAADSQQPTPFPVRL